MRETVANEVKEVSPEELREIIKNLPEGTMLIVEADDPEASDGQKE